MRVALYARVSITKVHAVVDALDSCLYLTLTPVERTDSPQLPSLLAALAHPPGADVCNEAYDTDKMLTAIFDQYTLPIVPPKASCLHQRPYDYNLYADRNKIERFFGRFKEARGATRYEKLEYVKGLV